MPQKLQGEHTCKKEPGISATSQEAFNPFSAGPRMCVGSKLAWLELMVTIARTLFAFDMRLVHGSCACCRSRPVSPGAPKSECDFLMKGYATAVVEGPIVQVRRREPGPCI